jgi:hypothetical protein
MTSLLKPKYQGDDKGKDRQCKESEGEGEEEREG